MIIRRCNYCRGTGKIMDPGSSAGTEPCPICGGLGEFNLKIPKDIAMQCRYCDGKGSIFDPQSRSGIKPCPVCKGFGEVEKPSPHLKYQIAVSYASEDREVAEEYANSLVQKNVKVFYDKHEQANLWGKDLLEKLDEVYRKQAEYCVIFISKHYAKKLWTNHERKSAQEKAFKENREYILPVKLDDTELPGIRETVGYIDLRDMDVRSLVEMTLKKLGTI